MDKKQVLTLCHAAAIAVALLTPCSLASAQQKVPPTPAEASPEPLSDDELEVLVARIALYPDGTGGAGLRRLALSAANCRGRAVH